MQNMFKIHFDVLLLVGNGHNNYRQIELIYMLRLVRFFWRIIEVQFECMYVGVVVDLLPSSHFSIQQQSRTTLAFALLYNPTRIMRPNTKRDHECVSTPLFIL